MQISPTLETVTSVFIPFIIMLGSNIAIIVKLFLIRKNKIGNTSTKEQKTDWLNLKSLSAMLISVCILFFLTNIPGWIYWSYVFPHYLSEAKMSNDVYGVADQHLYVGITAFAWYVNFAANFFGYVLSAPRFRRELIKMFKRLKQRLVNGQVGPLDTSTTSTVGTSVM